MPTQKRVIIYCRVSTDDQIDNTSLEQQEIDGREYCDELDFIVIDVIKEVYTGSVWRERKLFMKMRERYLAGEVQGVVVRTYSRFTRMIADYFVLTQEMREHNVKLYCVKEQYDDSPLGRCLQVMQMGFNESERETTRQRTIDGKRARVLNKQLYLAGKKPPYGLQFDDAKVKGKLIVNETEAAVVRDILHMRAAKNTIYSITKYLNDQHIPAPNGKLWHERSVRMIIERANDMYRGIAYAYKYEFTKEYRNGKLTTVKRVRPEDERLLLPGGTIPRIIDDETARLALGTATINAQEASRNNHNPKGSLLRSGFIKCGVCGRAMSIHTKKKTEHAIYPYYRCTKISLANRGDHEHIEISVPKIDAIVWSYLCKVIKGLEIIEEAVSSALEADAFTSPERAAENAIAECQALIAQYREDLKTTGLSKSARAVLLEDLGIQTELSEALEAELAAIRAGRLSYERVMQEYRTFIDWCLDFKKNGREQATYREKRDALRFLGVAVYIYTEESAEGRYKIRLSPPDLMRSLKVVPKNIAGASSG
jgi:site-specific DNA recombinase